MCVLRACVDRGFLCLIVVQLVRRILVEKGNPSLKQLQGLMEKLERERIHEVKDYNALKQERINRKNKMSQQGGLELKSRLCQRPMVIEADT